MKFEMVICTSEVAPSFSRLTHINTPNRNENNDLINDKSRDKEKNFIHLAQSCECFIRVQILLVCYSPMLNISDFHFNHIAFEEKNKNCTRTTSIYESRTENL